MGEPVVQIRDVEHFHWQLTESECRIPFSSNGSGISLAAAVELISIAANRRADSSEANAKVRVGRNSVWRIIKESRWPRRTGCIKMSDGDATLIVLPSRHDDPWWTQCIRSLLADLTANGFPSHLAHGLTGAVIEMVDNIWLHSETTAPGLFVYQIRRRKFAFSVIDTGIGVLPSLRKNPSFGYLSSSMDAIGKAIEPGVSRYQDGGGMGFPSLFHALAALWGTSRIRSGEAALLIDHTREERSKASVYLPHLPGTHISVRCALDPPSTPQQ
jgi:anti-sigma regulatory factor (Ser/Thr protein kinase)